MITSKAIIQKVIKHFLLFSAIAKTETHTTINTFSDTQRSEFVLFAIEKEDNQGQDALKIHPRTRCWRPIIQN